LSTFTTQQEQKYACSFEERFDLPDEQYETWLRVNHPEQLKAGTTKHGSNTVTKESSLSTAKSTITPQDHLWLTYASQCGTWKSTGPTSPECLNKGMRKRKKSLRKGTTEERLIKKQLREEELKRK